jgi:hypothetical protein
VADITPAEPRGYPYHLSDEALLKYMALPIEARLAWLDEARRFLWAVLPDKEKAIRKYLRCDGPDPRQRP